MSKSKGSDSSKTNEILVPTIEKSPASARGKVIVGEVSQEYFSGPIPPPSVMRQYEEILPGSAERILKMAENQSSHRISMESKIIPRQQRESTLGQIFGFILSLLLIGYGIYAMKEGHAWIGGIIVTVTLVSLAALFVVGRHKIKKDLDNKNSDSGAPID